MTLFDLSYTLLWLLTIVLSFGLIVLLYLVSELERQVKREGAGFGNNLIGQSFPRLAGIQISSGKFRGIDDFLNDTHIVLALSPGCGTCARLIRELSAASLDILDSTKLIVLCMGRQSDCQAGLASIAPIPTYIIETQEDSSMDIWMAGFPAALIVDGSRRVIDVRHPLTVKGLITAVTNSTKRKTVNPVPDRWVQQPLAPASAEIE